MIPIRKRHKSTHQARRPPPAGHLPAKPPHELAIHLPIRSVPRLRSLPVAQWAAVRKDPPAHSEAGHVAPLYRLSGSPPGAGREFCRVQAQAEGWQTAAISAGAAGRPTGGVILHDHHAAGHAGNGILILWTVTHVPRQFRRSSAA